MLEAVQNLYTRKIKPELVADRMCPDRVRRTIHDVADQLWADLMLELPHGLSLLIDSGAGGVASPTPDALCMCTMR